MCFEFVQLLTFLRMRTSIKKLYGSRRDILKACASLPFKGVNNEKMAAL